MVYLLVHASLQFIVFFSYFIVLPGLREASARACVRAHAAAHGRTRLRANFSPLFSELILEQYLPGLPATKVCSISNAGNSASNSFSNNIRQACQTESLSTVSNTCLVANHSTPAVHEVHYDFLGWVCVGILKPFRGAGCTPFPSTPNKIDATMHYYILLFTTICYYLLSYIIIH